MNHGHVISNADGSRARCGGPGVCDQCSVEASVTSTYARCTCGHLKRDHIYEEGACRPGGISCICPTYVAPMSAETTMSEEFREYYARSDAFAAGVKAGRAEAFQEAATYVGRCQDERWYDLITPTKILALGEEVKKKD